MNRIHRIRRWLAGLAGRAGALLAYGMAVPVVLASPPPLPPGWNKHPHLAPAHILHHPVHEIPVPVPVHTVITGGMPGWQITLIAAAAALLAAALAVLANRKRAARRHVTTSAT